MTLWHQNGKDRASFQYNAGMGRAAMYYGGTQTDKMQRRYRRYYSGDGSMEITFDKTANRTTFVTYIGGDAYGAPIIWHSDQGSSAVNNFYYLHRDYLGSILAITNKDGGIVEKRHFDAWGNIVKRQDGAGFNLTAFKILDRGYTGHEHLLGVGLINMNARLYDPILHRFLAPDNFIQDPFNTQNFNRYGYVLNNPLKFTDPTGEFLFVAFAIGALIGAIAGAASYVAHAIKSGDWNWAGFGLSILGGAIVGAISGGIAATTTTLATTALLQGAAEAFIAGFLPSYNVSVGDWRFGISPSVAFGSGRGAIGIGGSASYSDGKFGVSVSGTGRNGSRYSIGGGVSFSSKNQSFALGGTFYGGGSDSQSTWYTGYSKGDFSFKMTNDAFLSGDKFRTASAEIGIGNYSVGMNLYTTAPPSGEYKPQDGSEAVGGNKEFKSMWGDNQHGTYSSGSRVYAGLYIGVQHGNHIQRLGVDAPFVQDFFQNGIHKNIVKGPYFNTTLGSGPSIFQQNFTKNPWSLYSN